MSSQAYLSQLAQETIGDIISNFDEEDPVDSAALRACSLTCQSLLSASQAIIFSKIDLFSDDLEHHPGRTRGSSPLRVEDFYSMLQKKPHLAGYVRKLCLGVNYGDRSWISQDPQFLDILEQLQANNPVHTVRIYAKVTHMMAEIEFTNTSALERLVTPSITRLELFGLRGVPTSLLNSCVKMREFDLHQTVLDPGPQASQVNAVSVSTTRPEIPLHSFSYNTSPESVRSLIHEQESVNFALKFTQLRSLKTTPVWYDNMRPIQCILDLCAGTLEELHLVQSEHHYPFSLSKPINLSQAFSLRLLDIYVKVGRTDAFVDLSTLLGTIPTTNKIEKIILAVQITTTRKTGLGPFFDVQWELLSSQLARISSGKPLHFHLEMVYYSLSMDFGSNAPELPQVPDKSILEECKSTFEDLVYGKRLTLQDSPQIKVDVRHAIPPLLWNLENSLVNMMHS